MYCPTCKSEFRAGFERCEPCGVDLVASLDEFESTEKVEARAEGVIGPVVHVDYCGYLQVEEAMRARATLREHGICARVSIRESPTGSVGPSSIDEAWLTIPQAAVAAARDILPADSDPAEASGEPSTRCPACDAEVLEGESFCPDCGLGLGG